jgi:hypothetical protein
MWPLGNTGRYQLVSKFITLEIMYNDCQRKFADDNPVGLLPEKPPINEMDHKIGGWDTTPSNTFWTAGEFDPWRAYTRFSEEDFAPKHKITPEIPECGEPSRGEHGVFGYMVPEDIMGRV